MSEVIKAYPLQWPAGWKRTQHRTRAQFSKSVYVSSTVPGGTGYSRKGDLSIHDGVTRVREELRRMGIRDDDIVISTNLQLRLDGLPKSGQAQPADPGASVYWRTKGQQRCMAVDQYDRVEHNLAAIAATLDAMRAIKRHGGAEILDRAFTGFAALPPPITGARPWRDVLGVAFDERDAVRITECYRICRSKAHPDKGGTSEAFQAVDRAYEQACRELGFTP
jgi:hypothetical protein